MTQVTALVPHLSKIFADDTSLFSFVHDKYVSHDELNRELKSNK